MKNYDKIMEEMTPEQLATQRVKLVILNQSEPFYMTSRGQLYPFNNLNSAIIDEFNYLISDIPGTDQKITAKADLDEIAKDGPQPEHNEKSKK